MNNKFVQASVIKNREVKINNTDLLVKEFNGQRVVTFKDIDMLHERVEGTAKRNFSDNKKYFIKNVDYYELSKNDVGTDFVLSYGFDKKAPKGMLLTESGYLMLVKSLQDDLAWKVQRELVNNYFRVSNVPLLDNFKFEISEMIDKKLSEVQRYYKIKSKSKHDISSYIKKRLGVLRADGEYESVKARVFLITGISKWEDLDINKLDEILPIIDESIRIVKLDRPQQITLWE